MGMQALGGLGGVGPVGEGVSQSQPTVPLSKQPLSNLAGSDLFSVAPRGAHTPSKLPGGSGMEVAAGLIEPKVTTSGANVFHPLMNTETTSGAVADTASKLFSQFH